MIILQQIINGLLIGGTYALIGGGFSLVYGVMSIINLAHGAMVMFGAYITYLAFTNLHIDPFLTLPLSMLALAVLAYVFQVFIGNRVIKYQLFMTVVITFGLDLLLINLALLLFSANYRSVAPSYVYSSLELGPLVIPYVRIAVFFAAGAVTGLLYLLLYRSKLGMAIRATALNRDAARLAGIKTEKVYAYTFAIGSALAAAAGSLLSMILTVTPFMGVSLLGKAFAVAVLGGIGNVTGAIFGGMLLGVTEGLGAMFLGTQFQKGIAFLVLIVVLIFRPQGLMGRRFFG
jgi:branched-chain amino acid transport system permease protein